MRAMVWKATLGLLPESRERNNQELRFSLIHGLALMATRGYAAPEVEKTYTKSRELCHLVEEKRRLSSGPLGPTHLLRQPERFTQRLGRCSGKWFRAPRIQQSQSRAGVEALHALGTTLSCSWGDCARGGENLERIFKGYLR